jgi:hypothetical protein
MGGKCTKRPQSKPNSHKTHQMTIIQKKPTEIYQMARNIQTFSIKKYTQIGIFGMQMYHLATLAESSVFGGLSLALSIVQM